MNPLAAVPSHPSLAGATIDEAVHALRPDYRALLVTMTGIRGGPTDEASDSALVQAEVSARKRLADGPPEALAEVAAWREALLGFGVKPRQARSSLEALLRRVGTGLPRINRLTDLYNAVSVQHLLPLGGEDLGRYAGPPRLVRALGDEPFDTVADGEPVTLTADPGEVVWRDDLGVTCRRWNWRQCVRTRLDEQSTDVLFILDALGPTDDDGLRAAADALVDAVAHGTPAARVTTRLLTAGERTDSADAVICCQFIFRPGTYDKDFHDLDGQIDAYARSLPGFDHVETWTAPDEALVNAVYYFADQESVAQLARSPRHLQAKEQVGRWYEGYRIVVSEVVATYGDGRLDP